MGFQKIGLLTIFFPILSNLLLSSCLASWGLTLRLGAYLSKARPPQPLSSWGTFKRLGSFYSLTDLQTWGDVCLVPGTPRTCSANYSDLDFGSHTESPLCLRRLWWCWNAGLVGPQRELHSACWSLSTWHSQVETLHGKNIKDGFIRQLSIKSILWLFYWKAAYNF